MFDLPLFLTLIAAVVTLRLLEAIGVQLWRGYTAWDAHRAARRHGNSGWAWISWRRTFWSRLFRNIVLGLGGE